MRIWASALSLPVIPSCVTLIVLVTPPPVTVTVALRDVVEVFTSASKVIVPHIGKTLHKITSMWRLKKIIFYLTEVDKQYF